MIATQPEPPSRSSPCFERLMRLAGARPDSAVCAAGRGQVELMIQLCRDGYSRVECLRQSTCGCADEGSDILFIPGATATESLISILTRTAKVLRGGGVLALKLDEIDDDGAVQAALANLGLTVTSTVFDLSGEVLVAHRVERAELRVLAG